MTKDSKKQKDWKWWLETIGEGLVTVGVAFLPEYAPELIRSLTPEHTVLYKAAIPIGFFLKWLKTKYQKERTPDKVPNNIIRAMDKLPSGIRRRK